MAETSNPLAVLLTDLLRRHREVQLERNAFRELLSIALTMIGEHQRRIAAQERSIARLHDERRAARQQEAA